MMTIREYKRAETLEEAWQLNQKKANRVLGGMIWLKMENINVGTAIDLSGLGLDTIEETEDNLFWFQQAAGRFLRGTDALPRICGDRYSKAFGPHRGDTLGRSCAALPLPQ